MNYRLDKRDLLLHIEGWNKFLNKTVHLIACGGTAMTLLNIKESTKDVDFIVPKEKEYTYLISRLQELGYTKVSGSGWQRKGEQYIFDLFAGNKIHTTELLESPLDERRHIKLKEFSRIYLGILNYYDILISKLFRGNTVDFEDCILLARAKKEEVDFAKFKRVYLETSSYDISDERYKKHLDSFMKMLAKENIYDE